MLRHYLGARVNERRFEAASIVSAVAVETARREKIVLQNGLLHSRVVGENLTRRCCLKQRSTVIRLHGSPPWLFDELFMGSSFRPSCRSSMTRQAVIRFSISTPTMSSDKVSSKSITPNRRALPPRTPPRAQEPTSGDYTKASCRSSLQTSNDSVTVAFRGGEAIIKIRKRLHFRVEFFVRESNEVLLDP